jgi:hypothetical protein
MRCLCLAPETAEDFSTAQNLATPDDNSHSVTKILNLIKKGGEAALRPLESAFGTFTGKAALEAVATSIQENEAVNAAIATRIYDLQDREEALRKRLAIVENKYTRLVRWVVASAMVYAAVITGILYLVLRAP